MESHHFIMNVFIRIIIITLIKNKFKCSYNSDNNVSIKLNTIKLV